MLSPTAMNDVLRSCTLCPRICRADRTKGAGFCGGGYLPRAAKAYLHMWEEPCISGTTISGFGTECGGSDTAYGGSGTVNGGSGTAGSGTVFFSGCSLKCVYCQNHKISAGNFGEEITVERLSEIFLELQEQGAHNINLVSAAHYVPQIIRALDICGERLTVPAAYNSGGYEREETLEMLRGYASVFMPDIKYCSPGLSEKYSGAADYFEYASQAVSKMIDIAGKPVIGEDGIMKSGVIIRHMVLPSHYKDSLAILRKISELYPADSFLISLMSQYTPFYKSGEYKEINRRVSTYEYEKVTEFAYKLGFNGYMQERSSAKEEYTPDFDLQGIERTQK